MSYHQGFSTRLPYDPCAYNKTLTEGTAPYLYMMYNGKYENGGKCVYDHYTRPFDTDIVDAESELFKLTRPATRCPSQKYNPKCAKSQQCTSTFDKSVPVVLAPEVCPIVKNNLNWTGGTGLKKLNLSNFKGITLKN